MTGFANAFRAERFKTFKRKKYKVFLLVLLILYALSHLIAGKLPDHAGRGIAMGGFLLNVYLPMIAFLTANDLFASEIRARSIQQAILRPVSRMGVFFAKFACVFLNCAVPLLLISTIDTALCLSGHALGSAWQIVYAFADLIPVLTLCAFACFVSLAVHSPAFSMLLCIAGYIAMQAAGAFMGASTVLFTGYLTWHTLFQGGMNASGLLIRILMVVAPGVLFVFTGAFILEGKRF